MMRPDVKICGLKSAELVDVAIDAGAAFLGFMHFAKSPRHLDLPSIGRLIAHVADRAKTVVVLVDPDIGLIDQTLAQGPDFIQLHGKETPERVAQVKQLGVGVIKALSVGTADDLEQIPVFNDVADHLILDAKAPKGAELTGGNGVVFDWDILKALDPSIEFMLSGGLNVENVGAAVKQVRPYGLDVSSGVEISRGEKDAKLIQQFIRNAHSST